MMRSPGKRVEGVPASYLTEAGNMIVAVHGAESAMFFDSGHEANVTL